MPDSSPAGTLSVYVHIPYCRTRCLYCDFNTTATAETPWEETLETLLLELDLYAGHPFFGRSLTTLFFGGGTPSIFPPAFYAALLPRIFAAFPPLPELELTVECNPGTIDLTQLLAYRALGVNRLSFGVQSLNPAHLRTLTRLHGREAALEAPHLARAAGFEEVSLDLMFGVPGQSLEGWVEELEEALTLPVSHLSVYNLTPEEGTALVRQLERGRLSLPDEPLLLLMYGHTRARLRAAGFVPYEISNFARPEPCRHNLRYWKRQDSLGLGAGAHSFCASQGPPGRDSGSAPGGWRWSVFKHPGAHRQACLEHRLPLEQLEALSDHDAVTEVLMLEGRLMEGIALDGLEARFGAPVRAALLARAEPFVRRGLMRRSHERLALTDEGVVLADSLLETLSRAVDAAFLSDRR